MYRQKFLAARRLLTCFTFTATLCLPPNALLERTVVNQGVGTPILSLPVLRNPMRHAFVVSCAPYIGSQSAEEALQGLPFCSRQSDGF